jgi:hypothetical protein
LDVAHKIIGIADSFYKGKRTLPELLSLPHNVFPSLGSRELAAFSFEKPGIKNDSSTAFAILSFFRKMQKTFFSPKDYIETLIYRNG